MHFKQQPKKGRKADVANSANLVLADHGAERDVLGREPATRVVARHRGGNAGRRRLWRRWELLAVPLALTVYFVLHLSLDFDVRLRGNVSGHAEGTSTVRSIAPSSSTSPWSTPAR